MELKEKVLLGQATPEQVAEWKKKHPGLYGVIITDHVVYMKMPTFDDLNCAMATAEEGKPFDYWLNLANQTQVGGSEEVVKQPHLFNALLAVMKKKVEGLNGKLLEL